MIPFHYKINNPNNFKIKRQEYNIIPFGHRCPSAMICEYAGLRKMALPFDWCLRAHPDKIQKVLANNFKDFIPDVHKRIFLNKYQISFPYFNRNNIDIDIEKYNRRIDRFQHLINSKEQIYFVYSNEDYLYKSIYREKDFNDKIFNSMLKLESFIKTTYVNINYNILYFNFIQHDIPKDSNIINFVLTSESITDEPSELMINTFRYYCAGILSKIFDNPTY
jgi:hypothetical protein